jgi:3-hydroxy-9,10-secoandrosta-1,3,5(10)-triene-9,17-dione monooxygenase
MPDEADPNLGPYVCFAPASEVQLRDTWHTAGMRGTASHAFVAEDLFRARAPLDRTQRTNERAGVGQRGGHQLPLGPLFILVIVGTLLGLGQAAAELVIEDSTVKVDAEHAFCPSE